MRIANVLIFISMSLCVGCLEVNEQDSPETESFTGTDVDTGLPHPVGSGYTAGKVSTGSETVVGSAVGSETGTDSTTETATEVDLCQECAEAKCSVELEECEYTSGPSCQDNVNAFLECLETHPEPECMGLVSNTKQYDLAHCLQVQCSDVC